MLIPYHRLPLAFAPERLRADLALVRDDEWTPHFNRGDYEGHWSGVALLAPGGAGDAIRPDAAYGAELAPTPVLDRCAYFRSVLEAFRCPITSARLLKLSPRSSIKEHRDHRLDFADGEVRLHIPVETNPAVVFFVRDEPVPLAPGEVWYLNVSLRHRVDNRSDAPRVHLVLDCLVDDWLKRLFPAADALAPVDRVGGFEAFRALVLDDPALQAELREIADPRTFVVHVADLGRSRGFAFTADDVQHELREMRRNWLERWV